MSTTTQQAGTSNLSVIGDRELRVERIFDAPVALVWRAFSEPELVARWWGRGNPVDVERQEFEVGGHWRYVEHSEGETHGFEGRYREIVPQTVIERTFEWDGMPGHSSVERAEFEDLGDGRTRLVSTSTFFNQEERDGMMQYGMEQGMNESYAALDRLLASLK